MHPPSWTFRLGNPSMDGKVTQAGSALKLTVAHHMRSVDSVDLEGWGKLNHVTFTLASRCPLIPQSCRDLVLSHSSTSGLHRGRFKVTQETFLWLLRSYQWTFRASS